MNIRLLIIFICFSISLQGNSQEKPKTLSQVLSLKLPDNDGKRASAVGWHPIFKRYYAPVSGNANYIMAIFNDKGKLVAPKNVTSKYDVRGFWYNPTLKTFCANGYDEKGWISYVLNKKGTPIGIKYLNTNIKGQDPQSIGTYNSKGNEVYFLYGQKVIGYNASTYKQTLVLRLHINYRTEEEESKSVAGEDADETTPENVNNSVVVYTGKKDAEFALLDFKNKEIQFYNKKTGYLTQKLSLPANAPANEMLCFNYSNNIFWLFDTATKSWIGYK